jgi:hypothetical protein
MIYFIKIKLTIHFASALNETDLLVCVVTEP